MENSEKPYRIDQIDIDILQQLQQNARIPNVHLAKAVGLTPTPCLERVRRLEKTGYIKGYTAILDARRLGAGLTAFVEITLLRNSPDTFKEFRARASQLPEVLECHLVSGNFDYLIKARVKDVDAYRKLLGEKILNLPGVSGSRSYMVMEEIKETSHLPLADMMEKISHA